MSSRRSTGWGVLKDFGLLRKAHVHGVEQPCCPSRENNTANNMQNMQNNMHYNMQNNMHYNMQNMYMPFFHILNMHYNLQNKQNNMQNMQNNMKYNMQNMDIPFFLCRICIIICRICTMEAICRICTKICEPNFRFTEE